MPIKDPTLEKYVAAEQEVHNKNVARNTENISKISKRISEAEGAEKQRLEAILIIHNTYKAQLEAVDVVAIATEKFNKLQIQLSSKPK